MVITAVSSLPPSNSINQIYLHLSNNRQQQRKIALSFQVQNSANLHLRYCPDQLYNQPSMSDAWFKAQIAPDGVAEDGCHPDEAQALQSYLNNKITTQEAARAITQPILSSGNFGANLHRLWNLLQDALVELSETHISPLVNLLQAIQDLPDPVLASKPSETTPSKDDFTWKGLPKFGHLWADVHKQDNWRNDLSTTLSSSSSSTVGDRSKKRQELRATHIRKANIEARLVVANIGCIPLDWGYDTIADALELDTAVIDFEIPAAREWIGVAGEELYQGAKEERETWALSRKRDMGREDGKMSLNRWEFWEERMGEFQKRSGIVEATSEKAGKRMRELKRQGN